MTSRLKRKLNDIGVDVHSRHATENFCLVGTPLPPLEKTKDIGEFVPLWKQEVRDEKGRRRLHGAFTGGFSAGYFNTVGTKEGWTPSTFVSSRNDRSKAKVSRPEDFMDEEDLQELRDSQNLVDTTEEMDFTGGSQTRQEQLESDALEASILPAPKDSPGALLLKKMGWKLGQGIGPRVTLRQRRIQDIQAGVAVSLDDLPDDEEAAKHLYPPRDIPVLRVPRKDNCHGIGYQPGMGLSGSLGAKAESRGSGPKIAAGFGLGALNDADEDDLDVYDPGPATMSRNRMVYDMIDHEEEENPTISRTHTSTARKAKPSTSQTFRDGRPVLPGFVLADAPVVQDKVFPMPDVPPDWRPDPRRVWGTADKENVDTLQLPSHVQSHAAWSAGMSADEVKFCLLGTLTATSFFLCQRGALLGETPLPRPPRSVFEYMSQKDRERIRNIAVGGVVGPLPAPAPEIHIPHIEPRIAEAALKGFQPFTSDWVKQARYTAYLQSQASPEAGTFDLKPRDGQAIDAFNKELEDYAKAAALYKPMSGAMAGRFTSGAVIEHGPKVQEGLHTPSFTSAEPTEAEPGDEEPAKEEEQLSPKEGAARAGMFGPLTREIMPWQPAKLLCKRFGVKEPDLEPTDSMFSAPASTAKPSPSLDVDSSSTAKPSTSGAEESDKTNGPRDLNNVGLGEDDTQGADTLSYVRPPMDVFKAIFASDDESDSEDEDPVSTSTSVAIPASAAPAEPEVIDTSTFKPTFVPRKKKEKEQHAAEKAGKEKEKKQKRHRERKVAISFGMDDEDGGGMSISPEKPVKKKKRREKKREGGDHDDDDTMWVEKPPPEIVKKLPPSSVPATAQDDEEAKAAAPDHTNALGHHRARMRAVDFL
ncbi:DUF1604-domain-containing protein [Fistulina hepatica ATCC 64428]|uniref:DUF1604-domain-containing protein n=1 Tax=Fistulina hepatica ATCC 64428 TaxID=1128425 RepID=A0A0D6ZZH2_9AGAR|nr:DUF1604-domain-containing protein [Fistulina hepatica ATCC 64428]